MGISPDKYVNEVVANLLDWRKRPEPAREDIRTFLDRLANIAKPINTLTTETFSREMIYAEALDPDDILAGKR